MIARLRALLFHDRTLGAYMRMFSTNSADARLVLADLGRYCNFDRTTACVTAQGMDPIAMAYAEGRRDAFLYIIRQTNADISTVQSAIQRELEDAAA